MVAGVKKKKEQERKKEVCLGNRQRMELFKKVTSTIFPIETQINTPIQKQKQTSKTSTIIIQPLVISPKAFLSKSVECVRLNLDDLYAECSHKTENMQHDS